jgi:hypothetical protein
MGKPIVNATISIAIVGFSKEHQIPWAGTISMQDSVLLNITIDMFGASMKVNSMTEKDRFHKTTTVIGKSSSTHRYSPATNISAGSGRNGSSLLFADS